MEFKSNTSTCGIHPSTRENELITIQFVDSYLTHGLTIGFQTNYIMQMATRTCVTV